MISDLMRQDPECEDAIGELLREVFPYALAVFVPPGWDERYVTAFGFTLEELYAHGSESFEGRLRAAGVDPDAMRTGFPFDISPIERAQRGIALLKSGYMGEPNGPVTPDPEVTALLFDGVRRTVDAAAAPGARIQWEFRDAEPWHLRIDNGEPSVAPGLIADPDLTFRCRFGDWLDLASGRTDPFRALLTGKVRPRGKIRMLLKAPTLFG